MGAQDVENAGGPPGSAAVLGRHVRGVLLVTVLVAPSVGTVAPAPAGGARGLASTAPASASGAEV